MDNRIQVVEGADFKTREFSSVPVGSAFYFEGHRYLKTSPEINEDNAFNFELFAAESFNANDLVCMYNKAILTLE